MTDKQALDNLTFTLGMARDLFLAIPDVHSAHRRRLLLIERMVRWCLEREPGYWRGALEEVEEQGENDV